MKAGHTDRKGLPIGKLQAGLPAYCRKPSSNALHYKRKARQRKYTFRFHPHRTPDERFGMGYWMFRRAADGYHPAAVRHMILHRSDTKNHRELQ